MLLLAVPSDRDPGSLPGHFLWNLSRQSDKEYIFLPEHLGLSVNYRSTPPAPCYNPGNGRVTLTFWRRIFFSNFSTSCI